MKNPEKKKPLSVDQIIEDFMKASTEHFAFLGDHGLSPKEPQQFGHEFGIVYQNPDVRVNINYEHLAQPWIVIEKKVGDRWKRKGLHQLYKRVFNKEMLKAPKAKEADKKPFPFATLIFLGETLKKHWVELLSAL